MKTFPLLVAVCFAGVLPAQNLFSGLYPIAPNPQTTPSFRVTSDFNYLVAGEGISGRITSQTPNAWVSTAARLMGGADFTEVLGLGRVTGAIAETQISRSGPDSSGRYMVRLGGRNVGGSYRVRFSGTDAEFRSGVFLSFLSDVALDADDLLIERPDPNLSPFALLSNGTRIFQSSFKGTSAWIAPLQTNRDGDSVPYALSGGGVRGRERFSHAAGWLGRLAEIHGGIMIRSGNVTGSLSASQIRLGSTNPSRVQIGGGGIGGAFVFELASPSDAIRFADFLADVINADSSRTRDLGLEDDLDEGALLRASTFAVFSRA